MIAPKLMPSHITTLVFPSVLKMSFPHENVENVFSFTLHGISCRVSPVLKEFSRTEFLNVLLKEYCNGRSELMG